MKLKDFLKSTFGKDLFSHLDKDEILEERVKHEKSVERISGEIERLQGQMQQLMLDSKGKPLPMKLLNIQKIKSLKLESATKQQEARKHLNHLQLLLLVEAMREHKKTKEQEKLIDKIMNSDIDKLNTEMFSEEVKNAVKEGKIDDVKQKLKDMFAKEDVPTDAETHELLGAIEELENVDDETALKVAGEKAKRISEGPSKQTTEEE